MKRCENPKPLFLDVTSPSLPCGTAAELDTNEDHSLVGRREPLFLVLQRRNNIATLFSTGTTHFPVPPSSGTLTRTSALLFAFSLSIAFTCSRTLINIYDHDALRTRLVLLCFGVGGIFSSVLGGRWSDRESRRLTHANGGHHSPEVEYPVQPCLGLFFHS